VELKSPRLMDIRVKKAASQMADRR